MYVLRTVSKPAMDRFRGECLAIGVPPSELLRMLIENMQLSYDFRQDRTVIDVRPFALRHLTMTMRFVEVRAAYEQTKGTSG